jgi:hypothetical protein
MPDLQFLHQTFTESMSDYDLAIEEQALDIRRAEANGDTYAARTASQNLASLRLQRNEYVAMSNAHAASLRPAPGASRYGLSKDEQEIAAGISGSDPRLSREDRERIYLEGKQKLRHMRQTGEYRDDQGRVFK